MTQVQVVAAFRRLGQLLGARADSRLTAEEFNFFFPVRTTVCVQAVSAVMSCSLRLAVSVAFLCFVISSGNNVRGAKILRAEEAYIELMQNESNRTVSKLPGTNATEVHWLLQTDDTACRWTALNH